MLKKYAFLDRDGTLIFEPQDTFQIDSIEKLKILPGVLDGLKKLKKKGYELIMVSNQDGLGTPSFPISKFQSVQFAILKIFEGNGIKFDEIFICPHLFEDECECRKPKTGLVEKFLEKNGIDFNSSFMCGDRYSDREFAANLGIRFVPIKTNGSFKNVIKTLKL